VEALLEPFEAEFFDEVERQGKTALGEPKYWHVFHIVARKK
jgi:tellurite methyltransferase